MTVGMTVTKKVMTGYQRFGQLKAVMCDIRLEVVTALYILHTGYIVKPIDFGLKSISGIQILSCLDDVAGTPLGVFCQGNAPIVTDAQAGSSTTSFSLPDLSTVATDWPNGYVGQDVLVYDSTAPTVPEYGKIISDDSALPSVVVIDRALSFTPAAGDKVVLPNMSSIRCYTANGTEFVLGAHATVLDIRAIVFGN